MGLAHNGGVVSPANPAYTVDELAFQLKDSGAKAIVTQLSLLKVTVEAARKAGVPEKRIILLGDAREVCARRRVRRSTAIYVSSIQRWDNQGRAHGCGRERRPVVPPVTTNT